MGIIKKKKTEQDTLKEEKSFTFQGFTDMYYLYMEAVARNQEIKVNPPENTESTR